MFENSGLFCTSIHKCAKGKKLWITSECPRSKDRILMLLFIFHKIYSHLFSLKSICNSKFYNIFCLWECLECLVTLCALEWLLHVGPLMFFQVASYWEDLVILWAFKRLLSRVGLVPWWVCWEALVTVFALAWLLSHMGPSCSFKWPGLRLSCHTLSIQNVPWWVCW